MRSTETRRQSAAELSYPSNSRALCVGFLHLGPPEHGIHRYGQRLAQTMRDHLGYQVVEEAIDLCDGGLSMVTRLRACLQRLQRKADIIHVQYSSLLWGGVGVDLVNVTALLSTCRVPVIATLHDVYPPRIFSRELGRVQRDRPVVATPDTDESKPTTLLSAVGKHLERARSWVTVGLPRVAAWLLISRGVNRVVVHGGEELRRLEKFVESKRCGVVPHFVEERTVAFSAAQAKATLNLSGRRVVTLLGYIHARKGHELLLEALPELPQDVTVVFAGQTPRASESFLEGIKHKAVALKVADRLRVTGYLDEEELERYLIASDLAVCPFKFASASGSISTWLSVGQKVLASDLPQIQEYLSMQPDSIVTFQPYTEAALAAAIRRLLDEASDTAAEPVLQLRDKLNIRCVAELYAEEYRTAQGSATSGAGWLRVGTGSL